MPFVSEWSRFDHMIELESVSITAKFYLKKDTHLQTSPEVSDDNIESSPLMIHGIFVLLVPSWEMETFNWKIDFLLSKRHQII